MPNQYFGAAATEKRPTMRKYLNAAECPGFQFDEVFGYQGICAVCKYPKAKHPGDANFKSELSRKKPRKQRMSVAKRLSMAARKNKAYQFSDDEGVAYENDENESQGSSFLPSVERVVQELSSTDDSEEDVAEEPRKSSRSVRKSARQTSTRHSKSLSLSGSEEDNDTNDSEEDLDEPMEQGDQDLLKRVKSGVASVVSRVSVRRSMKAPKTDEVAEVLEEAHEQEQDEVIEEEEEEEEEDLTKHISNPTRQSRRESSVRHSILKQPVANSSRRSSRVSYVGDMPTAIAEAEEEEEAEASKRCSSHRSRSRSRSSSRRSRRVSSKRLSVVRENEDNIEDDDDDDDAASVYSSLSKPSHRLSTVRWNIDQEDDDDVLDSESQRSSTSSKNSFSSFGSGKSKSSPRTKSFTSLSKTKKFNVDTPVEKSEEAATEPMVKQSLLRRTSRRSRATRPSSKRVSHVHFKMDENKDDGEEEEVEEPEQEDKRVSKRSSSRSRHSKSSRESMKHASSATLVISPQLLEALEEEEEEDSDGGAVNPYYAAENRLSKRSASSKKQHEEEEEEEEDDDDEVYAYGSSSSSRKSTSSRFSKRKSSMRKSVASKSSRADEGENEVAAADEGKAHPSATNSSRSSAVSSGRSSFVSSVSRRMSRRSRCSEKDEDDKEDSENSETSDAGKDAESEGEASASEVDEDEFQFEWEERDPSEDFEDYFAWAGRPCRALYHDNEEFYPATIKQYDGDKLFTVRFSKGTIQKETELNDIQLVDPDSPLLAPIEARTNNDIDVGDLWEACRAKDPAAVLALLQRGDEPDAFNKSKETPLQIASKLGDIESAKFLLQFGANDIDGSAIAAAATPEFREFMITYGFGKTHHKAQIRQRGSGRFDVVRKHFSAGHGSRRRPSGKNAKGSSSWPRTHSKSDASVSSTGSTLKKLLCRPGNSVNVNDINVQV